MANWQGVVGANSQLVNFIVPWHTTPLMMMMMMGRGLLMGSLLVENLQLPAAGWFAYSRCKTLAGNWVCHASSQSDSPSWSTDDVPGNIIGLGQIGRFKLRVLRANWVDQRRNMNDAEEWNDNTSLDQAGVYLRQVGSLVSQV